MDIDFRLYLITDRSQTGGRDIVNVVEDALRGGVRAVQLREKDLSIRELLNLAYRMKGLTKRYDAKLFINDRVDIALSIEADGVHLGQRSMPPHAVRKICGDKLMIGVSAHSMDEALSAEKGGADFITFGPVFPTPSKLKYGAPLGVDALRGIAERIKIPVFALGGIKIENTEGVLNAGAWGISMISAIIGAEDVKGATEKFMEILG